MQTRKRLATRIGLRAGLALVCVFLVGGAPMGTPVGPSVPPGAAPEAVRFANEWPSPNGDLYNTRVAHSVISSANVSQLGIAWALPLQVAGTGGRDFANPVIADGVAYLQDAASNVTAVQYATGTVLWTHTYDAPSEGPNGVTIGYGRIYGVTATGVFALDAQTGEELWYNADFAPKTNFDIPPQVAGGKVFVSSAVTAGGGVIYALDAASGSVIWSFQTVVDPIGQQLAATAGGAWDAVLIGPDQSIYAGIGNPYLSLQDAVTTPSRQLYTNSIVKLSQDTGELQWYYQAFPNDFHDWDLQISPIYTTVNGNPVVLAAGKAGFVFAFDPDSGDLLWKTSVGFHNGHDDDGQLALDGDLQLEAPFTVEPGEVGGVETNMAAADGVVYVPVVNLPVTYPSATSRVGVPNVLAGSGEMVALDIATGRQLWATALSQMPLGGATVANDLVFTTTFTDEIVALSRADGTIAWTAQLPAGANATLAIAGDMLLAGAGLPLNRTQQPALVAYRLGAEGSGPPPPPTGDGATRAPSP